MTKRRKKAVLDQIMHISMRYLAKKKISAEPDLNQRPRDVCYYR